MKKLIAILLSVTLLFGCMAIPVSAELGDSDQSININEAKSLFERIADVFHDLVAKLFKVFGLECPLCENHDGYGEAEGDGDFNKAEIAKKYNDAVNELKAHRKTLKIEHSSYFKATIEEAPASIKKTLEKVFDAVSGCSPSINIKSALSAILVDNFLIGSFFEVIIVLEPLLILAIIKLLSV